MKSLISLPNTTNAGDMPVAGSLVLQYVNIALWNLSMSNSVGSGICSQHAFCDFHPDFHPTVAVQEDF
jgi:hypothetical protein